MADPAQNPALDRILRSQRNADAFDVLSTELRGTELTTLLLGIYQRRSASVQPADVMRQYSSDRFVAPSGLDALALRRVELEALEAASAVFEPVTVAPLMPFGSHAVMGATPQNNVVSTSRHTEVAADPTNSLALEAATRRAAVRADPAARSATIRLATVHRVTRAQTFAGPRSFAHFSLLGLVSAGRDVGNTAFEVDQMQAQIGVLISAVRRVTAEPIVVELTAFNEYIAPALQEAGAALATAAPAVTVEYNPSRQHGRGYYRNMCFKLHVDTADERFELGDGGDVWWTQELLQDRKERLTIAGLGIDRLALLATPSGPL